MLDNDTNKAVWVGVAIGLVAILGTGALAIAPDGFNVLKSPISKMSTGFANSSETKVPVVASNLQYNYDDSTKTATVVGLNDSDKYAVEYDDAGNIKKSTAIDLVVPENTTHEGISYTVTSVGADAISNVNMTSLSLPNTLTHIDDGAFGNSNNMPFVLTIPDSVTSIGARAFMAGHLHGVNLGSGVKSISDMAFSDNNFAGFSLVIPDSVTDIGMNAFSAQSTTPAPELKNLTLGKNLSRIDSGAFGLAIQNVDIPVGFNTNLYNPQLFMSYFGVHTVTVPKSMADLDLQGLSDYHIGYNSNGNPINDIGYNEVHNTRLIVK